MTLRTRGLLWKDATKKVQGVPHVPQGRGPDDIDHMGMATNKSLGDGTPSPPLGGRRQRSPFFLST